MKKRAIPVIIILFSLMLIGIIGIQAWWIKKSISLNEQAFDAAVYRSLEGVVAQTEKKENHAIITKDVRRDSMIGIMSKNGLANIKLPESKSINTESFAFFSNDNTKSKKTSNTSINIQMGSNGKKLTFSSTEGPFTVKHGDETFNVRIKLQKLDTMLEEMFKLKSFDSLSVKPSEVDSILAMQLKQNGLGSQKFNLALLNKKRNTYLYKTGGFEDTLDAYKVNLYPNDVFDRNIKLLTTFPDKFKQVSSGIWWAFSLSVLFTLAMLSLFIYSIRMLVKHKNLLAIKNDFISHMSHEFKTPLAGISIGADMITEKADKMTLEQITKTAQAIKEQSVRLNKDVSSVLLSTVMDEKQEKSIQPFDIVRLINQVVHDFRLIIDNRNATVKSHFTQNSIIIKGDKTLWEKVFSNLLDNALKFSKEAPLIFINASITASHAIMEFTDNGVGINKADLPHIFEKFYRSDYSNKSNIQGVGLGLSFVKKVVDMQGGTVKAVSEEGKGTSIFIEIPLNG
jgi:two-component system phosphate regulon sensor histidine kinase PhoR